MFDYYYGKEADSFSFIKIPKLLFTDKVFDGLSNDARLLYGLFLDRMSLSRTNGWIDEDNRVYIVYTIMEIAADLRCSENKAGKVLAELDSKKGIGLVEKKRRGLGMADLVYVKNFISCSNNDRFVANVPSDEHTGSDIRDRIHSAGDVYSRNPSYDNCTVPESDNLGFRKCKNWVSENVKSDICTSRNADFAFQEMQNLRSNNTEYNNTDLNYTDSSSLSSSCSPDSDPRGDDISELGEDEVNGGDCDTFADGGTSGFGYQELIRECVELDTVLLCLDPEEREIAGKVYDVMCDVVDGVDEGEVKVAGRKVSAELVKARFLKLGKEHFLYVIKQICRQYGEIRDFRAYAITVLYRAADVPKHMLNYSSSENVGRKSAGSSEWSAGTFRSDKGKQGARKKTDARQKRSWERLEDELDWGEIQRLLMLKEMRQIRDRPADIEEITAFPEINKTEEDVLTKAACM